MPEIGSTVRQVQKHEDLKTLDRYVYNNVEKYTGRGDPRKVVPAPPKAGIPEGYELVRFRDVRPGAKDPRFVRIIGDLAEFGSLDESGEFVPDYDLPLVARDGIKDSIRSHYPQSGARYYTLPRNQKESEQVYEFRSGRLIAGTLHDTGNFVPEVGSTILDFKDYDPNGRRWIYNLPGVLRKVEK